MKNVYTLISVILIFCMLFLPMLCIRLPGDAALPDVPDEPDMFEVYFPDTKTTEMMEADEYIWSVVAAEMPAEYEIEALKAQAVAAYTFACYRRSLRDRGISDKEYDVAADHTTDQAFITKQKAAENWGKNSEQYTTKIEDAVSFVSGQKLTYNGEVILASYYAISSGKTENCLDIWGSDRAYLVSVESEWDKESPKYEVKTEFNEQTLKEKLKSVCEFQASEEAFAINARSEGGSVMSVTVCGKTIKGTELRTLLGLRSANFEIDYDEESKKHTITTYGYGHGIGMSQFGANCLAKQGKTYDEILKHYYSEVAIE